MAGGKEIKNKISSVQNTSKITSAMEMVAASKMRRAQERMAASRPYADNMRNVIGHLANGSLEVQHSYLIEREVKRVGYIVISTDRGLCGGLNINLFKCLLNDIKQWDEQGVEVEYASIGGRAGTFLNKIGANVAASASGLGDAPELSAILGPVKVMLDKFNDGQLDKLYLVSNKFVNSMSQEPQVEQLLPLPKIEAEEYSHRWDYIYEQDPKELIEAILVRFVESQVYQGVVENVASEMAARMVAMKAATDNAKDLIESLELVYNKARQAAITQELSEIVSGAAAI